MSGKMRAFYLAYRELLTNLPRPVAEIISETPSLGSFSLSAESYAKHQFPKRLRLPSGKHVYGPKEWMAEAAEGAE